MAIDLEPWAANNAVPPTAAPFGSEVRDSSYLVAGLN